jgi:glycine/D-amino acid oxidase-like deaminating enzyme
MRNRSIAEWLRHHERHYDRVVKRRDLLRDGAMALVGFSLSGCAARGGAARSSRAPLRLIPVRVSYDRVIRATVGLRPHRPSGFVLRAEKMDGKLLIHNYGHGGSGMSLSWGTGQMAAELALEQPERRAAVIGCGVVGLTTARQLQRRGFQVTIYAASVPPDTTSNMSLAGFTPTSGLVSFDRRTAEWDAQFRRAVEIAYRQLQLLAGPKYGISWIYNYAPTDNAPAGGGTNTLMPDSISTSMVVLAPGQHPFPFKYAIERPDMRIEPSIYLDALVGDVLAQGGRIVIRKFDTPRELMALDEQVIVNCTGLGAKAIFNDPELMPLKGQLIVLIPQDEVTYSTNGGVRESPPGVFVHMMPRRDGIVLGGTSERDIWTTDINDAERRRVVDGHKTLFDGMTSQVR